MVGSICVGDSIDLSAVDTMTPLSFEVSVDIEDVLVMESNADIPVSASQEVGGVSAFRGDLEEAWMVDRVEIPLDSFTAEMSCCS